MSSMGLERGRASLVEDCVKKKHFLVVIFGLKSEFGTYIGTLETLATSSDKLDRFEEEEKNHVFSIWDDLPKENNPSTFWIFRKVKEQFNFNLNNLNVFWYICHARKTRILSVNKQPSPIFLQLGKVRGVFMKLIFASTQTVYFKR
jgi:hypothetical protein